jgi:hypothetical protein
MGAPEQALESWLFAGRPFLLLAQVNHEPLGMAKEALKERLSQAYDGTLFADNYFWSGLGLVLSVVLLAAIIILMTVTYDQDRLAILVVGMLVPVLPIVAAAYMIRAGWRRDSFGALFIAAGGLLIPVSVFYGLRQARRRSAAPNGSRPAESGEKRSRLAPSSSNPGVWPPTYQVDTAAPAPAAHAEILAKALDAIHDRAPRDRGRLQ